MPDLAAKDGSILINMESGGYDKVPRGRIDEEFDSTTLNPGDFIFEKTISGAYQGGLTLAVIKKAAEDGLFSAGFTAELDKVSELAAREIDDFLFYPKGDNVLARCCSKGSSEDSILLFHIMDEIFERIAKFVAFSLTAVMEKRQAREGIRWRPSVSRQMDRHSTNPSFSETSWIIISRFIPMM